MTTTDKPQVWIGCLACYNAGKLTGDWFDADEGTDVTPEKLHEHPTVHEELWVFDHEGFHGLLDSECSPAEAAELAATLEQVSDPQAYGAYAELVGRSYATPEGFEDAYQGRYDSRVDFAQDLADQLGFQTSGEWPAHYIDWDAAARDLFMDYATAPADGGIHVFLM